MKLTFLDFEQPIAELEAKIEELSEVQGDPGARHLGRDRAPAQEKRGADQADLRQAQRLADFAGGAASAAALHAGLCAGLFTEFEELHGDRAFADDPAIVGGLARFQGEPVMVIGHQKGRDTKERQYRNFGMPRPEGYRKALRLMRLAEKFRMPVFTFIDTPGAYPGIDAEERGQSEAIARNLYVMAELKTPIICTVIGEGGSGGALAIGVGDALIMLQYSTYSVISPEGCASILWKSADKASLAAEALGITAPKLKTLGLIDQIVNEPLGGAHRDPEAMMETLRKVLSETLANVRERPLNALLNTATPV
jgi:acetyl-CoA carboxylase carboxyl transferase subunit alpha